MVYLAPQGMYIPSSRCPFIELKPIYPTTSTSKFIMTSDERTKHFIDINRLPLHGR
jgi:hypothetical protein